MTFTRRMQEEGYYAIREISGKGFCGLMRFAFTVGLVIGMNDVGYYGRYCYHSNAEALKALESWDGTGDPSGEWIKYKGVGGERRNPILEEEIS